MPTAWVTSGRDPTALENVQADLLGRVRAYENRVPFVAANKCGSELGMVAYCGKSQIVDSPRRDRRARGPASPRDAARVRRARRRAPDRVAAGPLVPRAIRAERPVRIAIAYGALPPDIDRRLETLDDEFALSPGDDERFAALDRAIPAVRVDDALRARSRRPRAVSPGRLLADLLDHRRRRAMDGTHRAGARARASHPPRRLRSRAAARVRRRSGRDASSPARSATIVWRRSHSTRARRRRPQLRRAPTSSRA